MHSAFLLLHIISAFVLWGVSLKSLLVAYGENDAGVLTRHRTWIVSLVLATSILGLFTALSSGRLTMAVCGQLALYLSPAFIAFYFLQKRLMISKNEVKK